MMRNQTKFYELQVREAFALLLELRTRQDAPKLLGQAVAFLRMLACQGRAGAIPVVVCVQVMRLTKH